MLTSAVIKNVGQASHYFMERDDYYSKEGKLFEKESVWYGKGATRLGLKGKVDKKYFDDLLKGSLPNGQQIGLMKGGEIRHRPGFDLTLSACKSWSVAHYETKDPIFGRLMEEAAKFTFDMVERDCAMASMYAGGKQHMELTGNLVAAFHFHRLSREMEMQDHIHMVVMNATQRADGQWRALKSDDPSKKISEYSEGYIERVRARHKDYGSIYRMRLAHLAQKEGMVLEFDKNGEWELKYVSKEKLNEFSTRRKQIEADMESRGVSGAKAAAASTLLTRSQKSKLSREEIERALDARLAKFPEKITMERICRQHLHEKDHGTESSQKAETVTPSLAIDYAIAHLSEQMSVMTEAKILAIAMRHHYAKTDLDVLLNSLNEKEKTGELVPVKHNGDRYLISKINLDREKQILITFSELSKDVKPIIKSDKKFMKWQAKIAPEANVEQRNIIKSVLRTPNLITSIDARADSDKSTLAPILARFSSKAWYVPVILTPSNIEAEKMQESINANCMSISSYIKSVEVKENVAKTRHQRLFLNNQVLVINNAHRLSTKQGKELLHIQQKYGVRSILIHDSFEPESMAPGNFISLLKDAGLTNLKLAGTIQSPNQSIAQYVEFQKKEDRLEKISEDFVKATIDKPELKTVALVQNKISKDTLNKLIQSKLLASGQLEDTHIKALHFKPVYLTAAQKTLASQYKKGHIIQFTKDYVSLGVKKDTCYSIDSLDVKSNIVTLRTDDARIAWNPERIAGKVDGVVKIFQPGNMDLHVKDKVMITSRVQNLSKGQSLTISEISDESITLKLGTKKKLTITKNDPILNHMTLSYAKTANDFVSTKYDTILAEQISGRQNTNAKQFYSILNKAKDSFSLYTDNIEKHKATLKRYTGEVKPIVRILLSKLEESYENQQPSRPQHDAISSIIRKIEKAEKMAVERPEVFSEVYNKALSANKIDQKKLAKNLILYCSNKLSENEAVFTMHNLIKTVNTENIRLEGKLDLDYVDKAIGLAIKKGKLIPCQLNGDLAYTTPAAVKTESSIVTLAKSLENATKPLLDKSAINTSISDWQKNNKSLTQPQISAIEKIIGTNNKLTLVNGLAGVGKTTMLECAQELSNKVGYKVIGLAPTNTAARQLSERNIEGHTLDSFLGNLAKSHKEKTFDPNEKKLIVLDEASMASSKKLNNLLTLTQNSNIRLAFVGDVFQLASIEQGKMFWFLQRIGIETTLVDEIVRQRSNPEYLEIVKQAYRGDFKGALNAMQSKGMVYQDAQLLEENKGLKIDDIESVTQARILKLRDMIISKSPEDRENTAVITPANIDREAFNAEYRTSLQSSGEISQAEQKVSVLANKDLHDAEKPHAMNYSEGNVLRFNAAISDCDIKKGDYLSVLKSNLKNNHLTLKNHKGHNVAFNVSRLGSGQEWFVTRYIKEDRKLAAGDKIRWRYTDKSKDRINMETVSVIEVSQKKATVQFGNGKQQTLNYTKLSESHWDYAYAATVYTEQGNTEKYAALQMLSTQKNLASQPSFIVGITRAEKECILITDNIDDLAKQLDKNTSTKTCALEALGHFKSLMKSDKTRKQRFATKPQLKVQEPSLSKVISPSGLNASAPQKTPRIEAQALSNKLCENVEQLATHLLGDPRRRDGKSLFFGSNKGSLAVTLSGDYAGMWHDFQTGEKGNLIKLIQKELQLDFKEALEYGAKFSGYVPNIDVKLAKPVKKKEHQPNHEITFSDDQKKKIAKVQKLIKEAVPVKGTVAEKYLKKTRGISKLDSLNEYRFHPGFEMETSKRTYQTPPALLCIARDKDNKVQTVQAIFLNEKTAEKIKGNTSKLLLAPIKGALHQVSKGNNSNRTAVVCEGPEDALSIREAMPDAAIFTTFGNSNFSNSILLKKYDDVVFALDNDGKRPSELPNIMLAAKNLDAEKCTVWLAQPAVKKQDYNLMLRTQNLGVKAILNTINEARNLHDIHSSEKDGSRNFGNRLQHKVKADLSNKVDTYQPKLGQENLAHEVRIREEQSHSKHVIQRNFEH